jgi:CheY-like chemotaxis protein
MSAPQESTKTILVVDDEPHVVTYLETLLQDNGYQTLAAKDGDEALEMTRSHKPDLICLDITMPKKSGVGYYRALKEDPDLAAIPVVVVTAVTGWAGDPESFHQFISTRKQIPPPEGFVPKPIEQKSFLQTLEQVLGGKA